jgi:hypothetical protein
VEAAKDRVALSSALVKDRKQETETAPGYPPWRRFLVLGLDPTGLENTQVDREILVTGVSAGRRSKYRDLSVG